MAGEVVLAGHRLDPEAPVLPGPRATLFEDNHAPDRLPALEGGDVVALDPHRRAGEAQGRGQLLEGGQRLAVIGEPARLVAGEALRRVAPGQVDQAALLAAGRHLQADATPAALSQERLEILRLGGERRGQDRRRHGRGARVELEDEPGQDLVVRDVRGRLERIDVPPDQLPVAHREDLDGRLGAGPGEAQDVQLRVGEGGHLLVLHRPLDGAHLVPQDPRPFVLRALRGLLHLAPELPDEGLLAPLEEQLHLGDVGPVGVLPDGLDAGTLAALDVVEQAGPPEGPLAVADVERAGPEREEAADQVHRLVDAARRGVRTEVPAPVRDEPARPLDPGKVLAQADLDVRIALVVLEPDVEARLEPLDEVRLEEQRL